MWLGTKLTALSDYLFKTFFRLLFRYDIFISYARRDGKDYALKLRDQLKQLDFSCFLDFDELPPGNSLNRALRRALRRSATLVVVGTEGAVGSRFVELEVGEFAPTGRTIIPIDIEGSLADAPWEVVRKRDLVRIDEVQAALEKGIPSTNVADQIDKLFKYTRRNSRVRAQVLATVGLFVLVVAGSLLLIRREVSAATTAAAEAARQKAEAQTQRRAADAAAADAQAQKASADEATQRALQAQQDAEQSLDRAERAEQAAGEAAAEARRQSHVALANAARARAEQARAEERSRYIQAQEIAELAREAFDVDGDLTLSVLLSVESLKRALTPEGYALWTRGVRLLPREGRAPHMYLPGATPSMAYSPGGGWFAQGGTGVVTLFPADGRGESKVLRLASATAVEHLAFVRDGAWLAAAGADEVRVWNLQTRESVWSFNGGAEAVAFSLDGRYVALAGQGTGGRVRVLDTTSNTKVGDLDTADGGEATSLAFSPDGRWLVASSNEGNIVYWDAREFAKGAGAVGQPRHFWGTGKGQFEYTGKPNLRVAFDPQGRHLIALIWPVLFPPDLGGVRLNGWELSDEEKDGDRLNALQGFVARMPRTEDYDSPGRWSISFSPNGYVAVAGGAKSARVWELEEEHEVERVEFDQPIESLAFSADGRVLTTASGGLSFWETDFDSPAVRLASAERLSVGAFDPQGRFFAAVSEEKAVRIFRTSDWSPVAAHELDSPPNKLALSPDGRWLVAAGDGGVSVLETEGWKVSAFINLTLQNGTDLLSFSPDGRWLVMTTNDEVKLFESGAWREARTLKHPGGVSRIAFSPNGRWMAVATWSANLFVWDLAGGRLIACGAMPDDALEVTISPTPPAAKPCPDVKGQKHEALLTEARGWAWLHPMKLDSPDGRWAIGMSESERFYLYFTQGNVYRDRNIAPLGNAGNMGGWEFSPDGRWLASEDNASVVLWPLRPADMIAEACRRLRRHDMTAEEWGRYFSMPKVEPTCPR